MRFYKIDSQGPMFLNRGTGTPGVAAANQGRIFYEDGNEEVFYADAAAWIRMYSENNITELIADINVVGPWLRKDQDDTTNYRLTVGDGVIGDVRATNGTLVLENGSNGDDAHFTGDVKAENGDDIIASGADHLNSSARLGQLIAANGDVVIGMSTGASATIRLDTISDGDTATVPLADFSNLAGSWIKAEIHSDDGTQILNPGTDGDNAAYWGDVNSEDSNIILKANADRASSWASIGSVKASNGDDVLVTNTTVANSTFTGISERAKYA